jgi:trigger factor
MNVKSVENKEHSAVELVIEIDGAAFDAAVEQAYRKQRGSIAVPGFRKGKAPRKIIEGMYGSGVFYEDAINELYPAAYSEAVEQEKLDVVSYPRVEIVEAGKDGLTFKATVTIRPQGKIEGYKGLTAPKEKVEVTEEDIQGELKPLIEKATRLVTVDRPAKLGDTVILDFEGFEDGKPFGGGKGEQHELELGSNSFIPGFEEQVVGYTAGQEGEVNVTFPADYHAQDLADKPVVFKIKVHEVKEHVAPQVDDEFAKDVSEFDTLEELKKDLGDKLAKRRENQAQQVFEDALIGQLVKLNQVEIPAPMVEFQMDKMMEEYEMRIGSQGIPFETYLQIMGVTRDQMREQARDGATHQIEGQLALEAVAAAEGISISDEDLEAEYERMSKEYGVELEQLKKAISSSSLKEDLLRQKALKVVTDSAIIGEVQEKAEEKTEAKPKKKTAAKKTAKKEDAAEGTEEKPKKRAASKKAAKEEEKEEA